jgi:hypothetical protein
MQFGKRFSPEHAISSSKLPIPLSGHPLVPYEFVGRNLVRHVNWKALAFAKNVPNALYDQSKVIGPALLGNLRGYPWVIQALPD